MGTEPMDLPILIYPKDEGQIRERLTAVTSTFDPKTEEEVRKIIARVQRDGDKALIHFSRRFDSHPVTLARALALREDVLEAAWNQQPRELKQALHRAHMRINRFHENQRIRGFRLSEPNGNRMTQQVFPLRSAGVYVPGGMAAYPSSVLMNVIPARVAGVSEITMVTPPSAPSAGHGAVLAAAHLCGLKSVYLVGGAQAIAALALGTETIPRAEKVVGPGNRWVTTAKRLLAGVIDIDSVAGPSEVLILADHTADPEHVAADMLAQAEHDPDASAILILVGAKAKAEPIQAALRAQTRAAARRDIIQRSLRRHGVIIRVKSPEVAVELANLRAPEHCEVMMENPRAVAEQIRDAAAIFAGPWTPESIGDYVAGPNHVLPTGRTARFSSPLGVHSFIRRNHIIECTREGFMALAPTARTLATAEGFEAHRASIEVRLGTGGDGDGRGELPKRKARTARAAKPRTKKPARAPSRAARKSTRKRK
jgi:histidinol dehydrogenase